MSVTKVLGLFPTIGQGSMETKASIHLKSVKK